jgi:hypothetical protein
VELTDLRLFSEYICDGRYGWAVACEESFGTNPAPVCHERNTIAHLNDYEGRPEARPCICRGCWSCSPRGCGLTKGETANGAVTRSCEQ